MAKSDARTSADALIDSIDRLLPQTQCERCGYPGCEPYARAIATDGVAINRCAPGGVATIGALAALLAREPLEPDPACGVDVAPALAVIDEAACIGCTKCILACPVDAIVGAMRHRHVVLAEQCTGCERCIAPCPVDCITMQPCAEPWNEVKAGLARIRHRARSARLATNLAGGIRMADAAPLVDTLDAPQERARRLQAILARVAIE